mgnify:CR=1 FL=1
MKKWKLMPGNPGKAKHIEEELGVNANYPGRKAFFNLK